MREMLASDLFTFKSGSRERGAKWQDIATSLNFNDGFCVTGRAIRDRFTTIMKKWKSFQNKEKKASGIGGKEPSEFDVLMEELEALNEESERKSADSKEEKQKSIIDQKAKAMEIRQKAVERLSETKKRKGETINESKPKQRRSSSDTIDFLREKMARDSELKKEERELERRHQEEQTNKLIACMNQQQALMQQQFVMLLNQQQEQFRLFLESNKKKEE